MIYDITMIYDIIHPSFNLMAIFSKTLLACIFSLVICLHKLHISSLYISVRVVITLE